MAYQQSIEGCLETVIGPSGLDSIELERSLHALVPHLDRLKRDYDSAALALLRVPEWREDIDEVRASLERLCRGAKTLIFYGTGGSSLGGEVLAQLGGWFIPGEQREGQHLRPRTRIYDNLDARTLERTLAAIDLATSRFVVISKSGGTAETLVQFLTTLQAVKEAGLEADIPNTFLALSAPGVVGNGLRAVCQAYAIPVLDHHAQIPGRYSVFTNVGMIAGLARGLDVLALRRGARATVDEMIGAATPKACPPAFAAAVMVGLMKTRNCHSSIMFPYSDRLERFSHWYAQIWAESLGKNGQGSTPITALGPVDQHSQLQLYLDGPKGHVFTIIRHDCRGAGPVVEPELARQAGMDYMAGKSAGDLVDAQQRVLSRALMEAGRPVRVIDCERFDEETLGSLMMHFMIETILAARLLGVDPFDQPAVEKGKRLTRAYLTEPGEAQKETEGGYSQVAAIDR